jgi:hypothetical protein
MKDINQKENKMENEITKKEFEFKMNEYKATLFRLAQFVNRHPKKAFSAFDHSTKS